MNERQAISEPRLRFAVQALAVAPSAARRWVQLGMMQRARDVLDLGHESIETLQGQGEIDETEAALASETLTLYEHMRDERDDLFEEANSGPRAYMWSDALDDEQWRELRRSARQCYGVLSVGKERLVGE